jgi:hypothetical protein
MAGPVFTYGSLMFERVWARVVTGRYRSVPAILHGYRRQRVRGETYPSLERRDGAQVSGILYLDVGDTDLEVLDGFEGDDYRRIAVRVAPVGPADSAARQGGAIDADTYLFVADDKVEPGEWDPARFERELIERCLREYPPARG